MFKLAKRTSLFFEKDFKARKLNIPSHAFLFCLADHVGSLQIGHMSAINIYPPSGLIK